MLVSIVLFEPLEYNVDTKFEFNMNIGLDDYKFVFNTNTIDQLNNNIDINQVFGGDEAEENSQDESVTNNNNDEDEEDEEDEEDN